MIGPVSVSSKRVFSAYASFEIGDITITPFPIPHDANEPVGYNIASAGKKVTIATDIGHISMNCCAILRKAICCWSPTTTWKCSEWGPIQPLKQRIGGKTAPFK